MRSIFAGSILFAVIVFSTGCSRFYGPHRFISDQSLVYQTSAATRSLKLPDAISADPLDDAYPVPNPELAQASKLSLLPPDSLAAKIDAGQVAQSVLN